MKASKKILLRADGNHLTGLGHIYRLLALAEMFKDELSVQFICKQSESLDKVIAPFVVTYMNEGISLQDEIKQLITAFPPLQYVIVIDGYQFTLDYQKALKQAGYTVVYIDDFETIEICADIIINHSPGSDPRHFTIPDGAQLFTGTRYALLRNTFISAVEAPKEKERKSRNTLFICFGGADPDDYTFLFLKNCINNQQVDLINVVIGNAYKHDAIFLLQKSSPSKINIYRNTGELQMFELMCNASWAVSSASTTALEICCTRTPLICGYYTANQQGIYAGLEKNECIVAAGDLRRINDEQVKEILNQAFSTNSSEIIEKQKKMFVPGIKKRIQDIFIEACCV